MEDVKSITEAVKARCKEEAERLKAEGAAKSDIPREFIHNCLQANEYGDGLLFAVLNRDKYLFNKTACEWFIWSGHHWRFDVYNRVFQGVEEVALLYTEEAARIKEEQRQAEASEQEARAKKIEFTIKDYRRRVNRLRSLRGARNCLDWAHIVEPAMSACGEELDKDQWILGVANGVIELRTGRFREGRPEDRITKSAPHEWTDYDAPSPIWEKFLEDVFAGDMELVAYVQRLFGYGVTGLATEHILSVLHGEGRNGKSTFVEALRYTLGPLVQPIQSEMLLDQRNSRLSSGASPDLMTLKGLRIALASETDEGRRFSTSKAKWLSSGDTLTGRNLYDKHETTFEPTHLLCLLTNHLPHAPGDDYAFWQRIHLLPFKMKFVDAPQGEDERPKDRELPEKLKAEASGILAWLVRGCIEWQRQGLNPPKGVKAATEEYRFTEDLLAEFIESCCYPPDDTSDDRVRFSEVYKAFQDWYSEAIGPEPPRKKRFSRLMEKKFRKEKSGGQVWFYGLSLRPDLY
ncbi:MAG: phage/plasmid primase, P4 family [Thermodesulfobacteriota bacterium]|nr:MAG: phage/plasmid primase, P4 family [Thermodesulfobacteriota bacterium]